MPKLFLWYIGPVHTLAGCDLWYIVQSECVLDFCGVWSSCRRSAAFISRGKDLHSLGLWDPSSQALIYWSIALFIDLSLEAPIFRGMLITFKAFLVLRGVFWLFPVLSSYIKKALALQFGGCEALKRYLYQREFNNSLNKAPIKV